MRYPLIALLACLTSTLPAQLTIADGGTVTVSPRSVPTDQLVVTGNTVVDAGGTLDLRGLFVGYGNLDLRGILVVTVTGPDRDSQYGNLFMDGMTTLGGSLRISLAPAYAPTGTVEYTLVNALPVRDSFARVVLPGPNWQLRYEPEKVVLRLDKLTPNFDLLSFTGESAGRFIDLRWQTASERASDYFIVEQFISGSFQEVGRVAAAGDAATTSTYTFTHTDPGTNAAVFYRLRMVAADGSSTQSGILRIDRRQIGAEDVLLVGSGATLSVGKRSFIFVLGKDIIVESGATLINASIVRTELDLVLGGAYRTSLRGRTPGFDYGLLVADNRAIIDGELSVDLTADYTPPATETYLLVDAGTVSGTFFDPPTLPAGNWALDYSPSQVNLLVGPGNPAPVTWLDFTAAARDEAVDLKWTTGSEENSDYFGVERQEVTGDWKELGRVTAVGFSTEESSYDFTDATPGTGNPLYYRLRQVDFDGTFDYSPIVAVSLPAGNGLTLFPNPTTRTVYLAGSLPSPDYRITDVTGRTVLTGTLAEGERPRIDLPRSLPDGLYFLSFDGGAARRFRVVR